MKTSELYNWVKTNLNKGIFSDQSFSSLSNLTIIIPTYNRHDYLLRQLVYLSYYPIKIIVVDGSEKPLQKRFINQFTPYRNIKYHHLKISIPDRIRFALKKINTPYVMCLADDDFYIPSGLVVAMNKLKLNKRSVACMGQSLGLDILNKKSYFFPYGKSLEKYSIVKKNSIDRIVEGIQNYRSAAFYALFKTSEFIEIWKDIQSSSCPELMEYEHAIMTYLHGGIITSNSIYWVRSFECDPVPSKIDGSRTINFAKWYKQDIYHNERSIFVNRISRIFLKKLNLSIERSSLLIVEIFDFIYKGSHKGLMNYPKHYEWMFFIKNYLQKNIFKYSTFSISRLFIVKNLKELIRHNIKKTLYNEYIKKPEKNREYLFVLKIVDSFSNISNKK